MTTTEATHAARGWTTQARSSRAYLATALSAVALALTFAAPSAAFAVASESPEGTDQVAGGVYGIAHADGRTFIGGLFTRVGGKIRTNVAALDADGSVATGFTPEANGRVRALAASEDGSVIFLGGTFSEVGGAPRANLAAVDAVSGEAIAGWQANTAGLSPDVASLAVDGDRLYVAGRFTGIDGTTRKRLVALNTVTGDVVPSFKPAPNKGVTEVVVAPDGTVYAGGAFTMLGGQPRLAAGAVEPATGAATAFSPTGNGGNAVTVALSPDGDRFFYGTENNTLFAYDPATSNDPVWSLKTSGNTQAIAVSDDEMWIGGHFSQIVTGKIPRSFLASIDPADGSVSGWDPGTVGGKMGVWALALEGSHLHAGGLFTGFDAGPQRGYARFSQVQ